MQRRRGPPAQASSRHILIEDSVVLDLGDQVDPHLRRDEEALDDSFFGGDDLGTTRQGPSRPRKLDRQQQVRDRQLQGEQRQAEARQRLQERQQETARQRDLARQQREERLRWNELAQQVDREEAKRQREEKKNPLRQIANSYPLVRFIPAPVGRTLPLAGPARKLWEAKWVESELPNIILEDNRAGCHVCMMDFDEPRRIDEPEDFEDACLVGLRIAEEPLRLLPCQHVFHKSCLDRWLINQSLTCPYCRLNVDNSTPGSERS